MTEPASPSTMRRLGEAIPFGLWVTGALAAIIVLTGLALNTIGAMLEPVSSLVIAITIALLLTALLQPIVIWLGRVGVKQGVGAAITLLLFLLFLVGAFWVAGAQIATGAQELVDGVSAALDDIQDWLQTEPFGISGDQVSNWIEQGRDWVRDNWSSLAGGALRAGEALSSFTIILVLALVTTYFFLAQGRTLWLFFVRLLPRATHQPIHESFRRGWIAVRAYARTQIIVAAVDALGIGLGALVLGVPLVVPIAVLTFLLAFIPVVGAVLSGLVAVLIAFAAKGWVAALIMLGVVLAVQQIESNVLQPLLMSRAVDIHPWAVIIGVVVFSSVWGIMGALVSVPVMALVKVVVLSLRGHDTYPDLPPDPVPAYGEDHPDPVENDEPLVDEDAEAGGAPAEIAEQAGPAGPTEPADVSEPQPPREA